MLANKATPAELAELAAPIVGARERERRRTRRIKNAIAYVGLTVASFFMVVPFYYMIVLALSERGGPGLFHWPPQLYPFWPLQLVNFPYVFEAIPLMGRYFVNSTFISVLAVAGTIVSSSIAAYAFARLKFPGSNVLFIVMLATLMVPPQVTLIPQFILFLAFDWYDTYYPLLVPHWTGSAFAIFLMRQYFMTIPRELEDAARVDGANPFTIYWRVVLPLLQARFGNVGDLGLPRHVERLDWATDFPEVKREFHSSTGTGSIQQGLRRGDRGAHGRIVNVARSAPRGFHACSEIFC